ncbi:hypothetical protein K443DRAFT_5949 [Laccaria amethystina LaAM-08-1]|uniref:Uncharacterized protein n=1 Tax=Laccaria amethystina LaAM-08-1 TaxID=1095629 RepID=A0A0C9WU47_9AGAR|nr:hypothetical protein K443DRAFT_5949 [Laccaria amethystina LaAM-08-1]
MTLPAQPLPVLAEPLIIQSPSSAAIATSTTASETITLPTTSRTPDSTSTSTSSTNPTTPPSDILPSTHFTIEIPKSLLHTASWQALQQQNLELFAVLNIQAWQRLYTKDNKKKDKQQTSEVQHMTSVEVLDLLVKLDWQSKLKDVFKQVKDIFKKAREKQNTAGVKKAATEAEKWEKRALVEAEKGGKKAMEEAEKKLKKVLADVEKLEVHWLKEMVAHIKYALNQAKLKVTKEDPKQKKAVKTVHIQEKSKHTQEWREEEAALYTPARVATCRQTMVRAASTMDLDAESFEQLSQVPLTPID